MRDEGNWAKPVSELHIGHELPVEARATVQRVVVDRKRQWEHWRNIKKNAAIRSGIHMAGAPMRAIRKPFARKAKVAS